MSPLAIESSKASKLDQYSGELSFPTCRFLARDNDGGRAVAAVTGYSTHSQRRYHISISISFCPEEGWFPAILMTIVLVWDGYYKEDGRNAVSMISSVGDRTVSMDNRRCSIKRQVSF
eukprot:scaffold5477_cov75-Skeletonema_dohrnii-CCMP3373.AAC.3